MDKEFLLDGITNGFQLLPSDAPIQPAEMNNYFSTVNPLVRDRVEKQILEEIAVGNYVSTSVKPTIISALGAVPKPDSEDLRLIHDCSMPPGQGVNNYIEIEKQKFQTLDDAVKLIKQGYYMAKIDLRHAYRSVPVHPSNYNALGLKWRFTGETQFTYLVDTRLPFGGRSAPGIFHRLTQSVRRMMARRGFDMIIVYLDDFLVIGKTKAECQAAFDTLRDLLQSLGFELSPSKVILPCQRLVFLGIFIDAIKLTLSLPAVKLAELRSAITTFTNVNMHPSGSCSSWLVG